MILENFVNELGKICRIQLREKLKTDMVGAGWLGEAGGGVSQERRFTHVGNNSPSFQPGGMRAVGMGTIIYCHFPQRMENQLPLGR